MFWLNPYVFGTAVGSPWPQSSLADLHGTYMGLVESYGTCTRFSWEFHRTIWGSPWGVQGAAMALPQDPLGTPWDYSAAMGHPSVFRATYVGPPWYFQRIPALPCNFHGTSMGFHGILWDFNALAWDCHESPRNPTDHKINMSASDTYIKYKQWWPFFRTDGPTFLTRCAVPNAAVLVFHHPEPVSERYFVSSDSGEYEHILSVQGRLTDAICPHLVTS